MKLKLLNVIKPLDLASLRIQLVSVTMRLLGLVFLLFLMIHAISSAGPANYNYERPGAQSKTNFKSFRTFHYEKTLLIADAQKGNSNSKKATRAAIVMKSTTKGDVEGNKEEETTAAKDEETTAAVVEVTKDVDP
jgi:hypothetical protein